MNNDLAILALLNDKHKFKKKELIDFFSGLNSIEDFFVDPPNSTELQNDQRYSKISKKITSMLELYSDLENTCFSFVCGISSHTLLEF